MKVEIEPSWQQALLPVFESPQFEELTKFVRQAYTEGICYPPPKQIFNAFNLCPISEVRVVIIGQDPYHQPGQAHGLCFSVPEGVPAPPSLQNIQKELLYDIGQPALHSGDLTFWAKQGVLLLNSVLTVADSQAGSHANKGWEELTDYAIKVVSRKCPRVVFMLWGTYAKKKAAFIDSSKHLILAANHPSPLSANRVGWFGNKHFSQANGFLLAHGYPAISWNKPILD